MAYYDYLKPKNGEQKPNPSFESGTMQDIQTMREKAAVNLDAAMKYGMALDEMRVEIQDITRRITEIAPRLGRIHDILKRVGK